MMVRGDCEREPGRVVVVDASGEKGETAEGGERKQKVEGDASAREKTDSQKAEW